MKKNPTEIFLSAPLELSASADGKIPAKFSGIAYSGGLAASYGVVVDIGTTEFAPKMPLLAEHDRSQIIGVISDSQKSATEMTVAGTLFSDLAGSRAEQIAQLAQRGAPYQMSIGLYGYNEMFVPSGKSIVVNARNFQGPVTVLTGGKVREVSVVSLGADPDTAAQFFHQPSLNESEAIMNLQELTARVAELTAEVQAQKDATGAAVAQAVQAERNRLLGIEAQMIPGHEALIATLKADGKSTPGDAAQAVLAAERKLRQTQAQLLADDAPKPLAQTPAPAVSPDSAALATAKEAALPLDERCKAQWERDADLRKEFGAFEAYLGYEKAVERGGVKILGKTK